MYQSGIHTPLERVSSAPDTVAPLWNHTTLTEALTHIRRAILPRLGAAAALAYLNTLSNVIWCSFKMMPHPMRATPCITQQRSRPKYTHSCSRETSAPSLQKYAA